MHCQNRQRSRSNSGKMEVESIQNGVATPGAWESLNQRWNSWISLNSAWSSKWWYAAVHIITAAIGAGVLNLHTSMAALGWELGIILLLWFIVLSLICYSQMVEMHERPGRTDRMDRYRDLSEDILGKNYGFWLVVPFQTILIVFVDIVYIITGATSLKKIFKPASHTWPWTLGFGSVQLLLAQLPNLTSLTWISIMAAFAAIGYSTLTWIAIISSNDKMHNQRSIEYSYPTENTTNLIFSLFSALGQLAFACSAGQNIAAEIQATIPSVSQRPSKVGMWLGVLIAYLVVAFCYIPVAVAGYWYFGNDPPDDCQQQAGMNNVKDCHLLLALTQPKSVVIVANALLTLHLCGSYQVFAMPLFESTEYFIQRKLQIEPSRFSFRLVCRSIYVVFTTALATLLSPGFGAIQTIIGGLANMPTSYVIPCILWHKITKPRRLSLKWLGNMFCIAFGLTVMLLSTVGSINTFITGDYFKYYENGIP